MSRRLEFSALVALLASIAIPAQAAESDAPRLLLERVQKSYRELASYRAEGTVTLRMTSSQQNQAFDIPIVAAGALPGRSRTEMRHPTMGSLRISDGRQTVTYLTQTNSYTRTPVATAAAADSAGPPGSPLARYFTITAGLLSARFLPPATVAIEGRQIAVQVVEAEYPLPAEMAADPSVHSHAVFWIDAARGLVLRDSTHVRLEKTPTGGPLDMVQTTAYTALAAGEPLPDSTWAFTPPPGAHEVANFQAPQQPAASDMSGQKATDFSLVDLAGRTRTLSAYRGKVVLLDFWATWCGPCRISMPHVEKLHREYKAKGLVVLGIDIGESADKVRPFLAKNGYDFTVLLDRKTTVAQAYQASAIPTTVIIDRKGMIVAYFTGVRGEDELRAALKKAGL
jgi:peroxiredoxin